MAAKNMRAAAAVLLLLHATLAARQDNDTKTYEYNIVVVGDIHDDVDALYRLRDHLQRHSRRYDMLLCTGDLTSMAHEATSKGTAGAGDVPRSNAYMRRAAAVAEALAAMAPLAYFVPGALDPLPLYDAPASAAPANQARNAHEQVEEVTRGLWVAGLGGAPAPFEYKGDGSKSTKKRARVANETKSWLNGFPYDDAEFKKRQQSLRKTISKIPAGDAVLLLTHAGPDGAGTSLLAGADPDSIDDPKGIRKQPLHAGSAALHDLLAAPASQRTVLLSAHGRAHAAGGVARFGRTTVVNPGSLRYTRQYGTVTLMETRTYRPRRASSWRVVRAAIHDADDRSLDAATAAPALSPGRALVAGLALLVFGAVAARLCVPRADAPRSRSWRRRLYAAEFDAADDGDPLAAS
jgi:Icc-related predicted phosphoesterase